MFTLARREIVVGVSLNALLLIFICGYSNLQYTNKVNVITREMKESFEHLSNQVSALETARQNADKLITSNILSVKADISSKKDIDQPVSSRDPVLSGITNIGGRMELLTSSFLTTKQELLNGIAKSEKSITKDLQEMTKGNVEKLELSIKQFERASSVSKNSYPQDSVSEDIKQLKKTMKEIKDSLDSINTDSEKELLELRLISSSISQIASSIQGIAYRDAFRSK